MKFFKISYPNNTTCTMNYPTITDAHDPHVIQYHDGTKRFVWNECSKHNIYAAPEMFENRCISSPIVHWTRATNKENGEIVTLSGSVYVYEWTPSHNYNLRSVSQEKANPHYWRAKAKMQQTWPAPI